MKANKMIVSWSWREIWFGQLWPVMVALTLIIACVVALSTLALRVEKVMTNHGRSLLAADLVFKSANPLHASLLEKAQQQVQVEQTSSGMEVGQANIKVIGCGGAGNNMVNWLYKKGIKGAEIIACNTDLQHLQITEADKKFLIGKEITRGLGCGGFPEKGAESAKESTHTIDIEGYI